jgi:putative oxidoreductase
LLLRLAAAIPLLIGGSPGILEAAPHGHYIGFIATGVGASLLAGLWTPIAATLQVIIEVSIILGQGGGAEMHLLLAALGVSLVMVGPGAWSVDARIFGRKRINIPRR